MIERRYDIPFIADLALREKQVQQNYRPIIAVHKWFARRPGTLFRGLLLAEFSEKPLREAFYQANYLPGLHIADPFMGGGTPLLEANRVGCDVIGNDINPMSYWIVKQELEHLDLDLYVRSAYALRKQLDGAIGQFYRTSCIVCGAEDAPVKYFLWVKTIQCRKCLGQIDLFPGYLLAADSRHPKNVFVCPACGELTEASNREHPGFCRCCGTRLLTHGPAKRNRCKCPSCETVNLFPDSTLGPPQHRLFAIEYHCSACKSRHPGRLFKRPEQRDRDRLEEAEATWAVMSAAFVPTDEIPSGDETGRLHRWGYRYYREMFNARQLLGLETSSRLISETADERIRNALATNLSDLLRYQNMLCRYDTKALKSLDIFSVHGFPVGLIQCESNILGILEPNSGTCVGSGGWANVIEKFRKAKAYCEHPYEVRHSGRGKEFVRVAGEWIGDHNNGDSARVSRVVDLRCQDSATALMLPGSLDAVFTDPPYFGNVQYAELMDFCYVWLRRLIGSGTKAFERESTRNPRELTGNEDMGRGLDHFADGLSAVFRKMALALKPGAPLAFTYHHNDISAYYPVAIAILDAGLTCSASFPCPAEMSASIHISATGSSIVDTVFVCRSTGVTLKKWLVDSALGVACLVRDDLQMLRTGNVKPTWGDARCIAYGHLVRLAVWYLRKNWNAGQHIERRVALVEDWLEAFGSWSEIEKHIEGILRTYHDAPLSVVREEPRAYGSEHAEVPF